MMVRWHKLHLDLDLYDNCVYYAVLSASLCLIPRKYKGWVVIQSGWQAGTTSILLSCLHLTQHMHE